MDEMREGLRRFGAGLKKLLEAAMTEDKKVFTFGDILDLLGRDHTVVTVRLLNDTMQSTAKSALWGGLEERRIKGIAIDYRTPGLEVWLEEEPDGEE